MQPQALRDEAPDDLMNLSPELTRDFRGLRMWLPLKLLGAAPFRSALEEKLSLAKRAAEARQRPNAPCTRMPP